MVIDLSKASRSYQSVDKAVKKAESDCSDEEVEEILSFVQELLHEQPDIVQLRRTHATIQRQVEVVSRKEGRTSPNLDKLAGRVESLIQNESPKVLANLFQVDISAFKAAIKKVKDLEILYQTALLCAQKDPKGVAENIKDFRLKGCEEELYRIAAECRSPRHIALFRKEGLRDEHMLFSVLLRCIEKEEAVEEALTHFKDFGIKDKEFLQGIGKAFASKRAELLLENIQMLGIEKQEDFVAIIKICAEEDPGYVAQNIHKFLIEDEADRAEIAKVCIGKDGDLLRHIDRFQLSDQALIFEVVVEAAKEPELICMFFPGFGITDEKMRFEIAKMCAKNEGRIALYIEAFCLEKEEYRFEVAKIAIKEDPNLFIRLIDSFELTNKEYLFELAKVCVESGAALGPPLLANFKIEAPDKISEIIEYSIFTGSCPNPLEIRKFGLERAEEERLLGMAYSFGYLNRLIEGKELDFFNEVFCPQMLQSIKRAPNIEQLALPLENPKEICIAYFSLCVLGTKIQKGIDVLALKRIYLCRNGPLSISMAKVYSAMQRDGTTNTYRDAVKIGEEIQDLFLLPLLYPSKWVSEGVEPKVINKLRGRLALGGVKKGFSGSGGSLEKAWLNLCQTLDNIPNYPPESKMRLLVFVIGNLNSKDPKGDLLKRLGLALSVCQSNRMDLLDATTEKMEAEMRSLESKRSEAFPEIEELIVLGGEKSLLDNQRAIAEKDLFHRIPELVSLKEVEKERGALDRELKKKKAGEEERALALAPLNVKKKELLDQVRARRSSDKSISELEASVKKMDKRIQELTQGIRKLEKSLQKKKKADVRIKGLEKKVQDQVTGSLFDCMKEVLVTDPYLDLKQVTDLEEKYLATFAQMRVAGAWKIYEATIQKTGDPNVQAAFNRFIISVLNGTYIEDRYANNNPHIAKILEKHGNIWELWSKEVRGEPLVLAKDSSKEYEIVNTDDWQDLFLSGTEIPDSCQNIAGFPHHAKTLIGYPMDGKNRIVAIKEGESGKIVARSVFRLLWNETTASPALLLEVTYPFTISKEFGEKILQYAQKEAERIRCPLYTAHDTRATAEKMGYEIQESTDKIVSLGSSCPFEYADSSRQHLLQDGTTEGVYTVAHPFHIEVDSEA